MFRYTLLPTVFRVVSFRLVTCKRSFKVQTITSAKLSKICFQPNFFQTQEFRPKIPAQNSGPKLRPKTSVQNSGSKCWSRPNPVQNPIQNSGPKLGSGLRFRSKILVQKSGPKFQSKIPAQNSGPKSDLKLLSKIPDQNSGPNLRSNILAQNSGPKFWNPKF